ncbi:RNA-directed DNA polymerase, eukaryota, nucleotide-binding alpha-beta plait domain protein [Tanacetum coccineum]
MGFRPQNSLQSKFDHTSKISKSVFITNFPDDCSSKDIWKACKDYGTVIDVFIPNKKSKAGKRFAFVRFIRVINFDRLIENLKTIWIGSFHLFANPVRFEGPKAHTIQNEKPVAPVKVSAFKKPNATYQGGPKGHVLASLLQPSLVLDDSCLVDRDLANCVMGEVCQFSSINNLQGNFCLSPSFLRVSLKRNISDNESVKINEEANNINNGEEENDSEVVSDTYFGDNGDDQVL